MGRTRLLAVAIVAVAAVGATIASTAAMAIQGDEPEVPSNSLRVMLSGYQEDPAALSTAGSGQFQVQIDEGAETISYELSYADLEGTVTQSHIHIGNRSASGGISVFLCTNLGNSTVPVQACPAAPATISGVITPASVVGPTGQGVTAGQFAELIAAIRAGSTYVNVHSSLYSGGEIRAQLDHDH